MNSIATRLLVSASLVLAGFVILTNLQEELQIKARQCHDHSACREVQVHQNRHAVDMEEREKASSDFAGTKVRSINDLIYIDDEIAMREANPFW